MVVLNDTDNLTMWICEKYGVSMLASHAADMCARRFAAANSRGNGDSISFSHCRTCARGRAEYARTGIKKCDVSVKKKQSQNKQARN